MRPAVYLLLYLFVLVAIAFAFGSGTIRIGSDPHETAVPWGNRVLDSPEELSSWLAARGATYEGWARRHPQAAARLELRRPTYIALDWPPTLRGRAPTFATRTGDALERGAGGAAAAAIAGLALAAAFALRRRVRDMVVEVVLLLAARIRSALRGAARGASAGSAAARPHAVAARTHTNAALARLPPLAVRAARVALVALRIAARHAVTLVARLAPAMRRAARAAGSSLHRMLSAVASVGVAAIRRPVARTGAQLAVANEAGVALVAQDLELRAETAVVVPRQETAAPRVPAIIPRHDQRPTSPPPVSPAVSAPEAAPAARTAAPAPVEPAAAPASVPRPAPQAAPAIRVEVPAPFERSSAPAIVPPAAPVSVPAAAPAPLTPAPPPAPAPVFVAPAAVAAPAEAASAIEDCEIRVWHGYVKSHFYAVRIQDERTLAHSPPFRRSGDVPKLTPAAQAAYDDLFDRLVETGWEPDGRGAEWYAGWFRLRAAVA